MKPWIASILFVLAIPSSCVAADPLDPLTGRVLRAPKSGPVGGRRQQSAPSSDGVSGALRDSLRGVTDAAASTDLRQKDCQNIARLRDRELFRDWDAAVRNASIYAEQRDDLATLRAELLDNDAWAANDWVLLRGVLAGTLKTTSDLTGNLLAFAPMPGSAIVAPGRIKNALMKNLMDAATSNVVKRAKPFAKLPLVESDSDPQLNDIAIELAAELNPVGKTVKLVKDLVDDIHETASLSQDRNELRDTLRERLDAVEAALVQNAENLRRWNDKAATLDALKIGMDSYLSDQCR